MHNVGVELPDGRLLSISGGDAESTAKYIINQIGGSVKKPITNAQPMPQVINDLLVLCNGTAGGAAPEPPPGAVTGGVVTPLELPTTAEENWPNRYVPPVPYQAEVGTFRKTPIFSEGAAITPLENPAPMEFTAEEKAAPAPKFSNSRPPGADGLVNNGITPLELPKMF